jgi:hypothetical protein
MSAELPELERLIADAAERHYGGRRRWLPTPRLSLVAGVVVAAAAVVLAIAIFPLDSDEQAASPAIDNPAAELGKRYAIFARGQDVGARAYAVAEDQLRSLAPQTPVAVRMLRSSPSGDMVAVAGTGPEGKPALCFAEQTSHSGGGGCIDVADLPSDEPWFVYGVPGARESVVTAIVPDAVQSVRMELESGATRNVPIENNLAYAKAGKTVCAVSWTTDEGRTDRERSLFDGEAAKRC